MAVLSASVQLRQKAMRAGSGALKKAASRSRHRHTSCAARRLSLCAERPGLAPNCVSARFTASGTPRGLGNVVAALSRYIIIITA